MEKRPMCVTLKDGSLKQIPVEDIPDIRFEVRPMRKLDRDAFVIVDLFQLLGDTCTLESDEFIFTFSEEAAKEVCKTLNRYDKLDPEIKRQIKQSEKK